MKITRVHEGGNYTRVPNETVRDRRLSFRARGVLAYILSHTSGRQITADTLAGDSEKDGRDSMLTVLRELRQFGYVVQSKVRGDVGRKRNCWTTQTEVFDVAPELLPKSGSPKSGNPTSESDGPPAVPESGSPTSGFRTSETRTSDNQPLRTEKTSKKTSKKTEQKRPFPAVGEVPVVGGSAASRRAGQNTTRSHPAAPPTAGVGVGPVIAHLPAEVAERLGDVVPQRLVARIARALGTRTVDELHDRIDRRWIAGRLCEAVESGRFDAVAIATALIRPPDCPDVRCEDGTVVAVDGQTKPCVTCGDRLAAVVLPLRVSRRTA